MENINKWVYFCLNYPYDFIEQVWGGTWIYDHLKGKFQDYYDLVGPYGVMSKFYCNLDKSRQRELLQWVMDNYNDEQKKLFERLKDVLKEMKDANMRLLFDTSYTELSVVNKPKDSSWYDWCAGGVLWRDVMPEEQMVKEFEMYDISEEFEITL